MYCNKNIILIREEIIKWTRCFCFIDLILIIYACKCICMMLKKGRALTHNIILHLICLFTENLAEATESASSSKTELLQCKGRV